MAARRIKAFDSHAQGFVNGPGFVWTTNERPAGRMYGLIAAIIFHVGDVTQDLGGFPGSAMASLAMR
jgi:hypothetical protein